MKQSLKIGLIIGVVFASISALVLKFISITYWSLVILLYLYCATSVVTSYFVYKITSKRVVEKIEKKIEKIFKEF